MKNKTKEAYEILAIFAVVCFYLCLFFFNEVAIGFFHIFWENPLGKAGLLGVLILLAFIFSIGVSTVISHYFDTNYKGGAR